FLDGEEGGDTFISSFQGGNSVSFASLVDTGGSGVDVFVVVGTIFDDQFLLRANNDGSEAFVAMINNQVNVERINYNFTVERIVVNGSLGDDHFAVDDTAAEITMNGELGNDTFQVGQLFRSQRTAADANISITPFDDQFATIETTRGFLSNGISAPMTINGGLGDDNFTVFHNKAVLQLNGGEGDDIFEIRAFALAGSQEPQRERTDITGGAGADLVQYAVNAPVNIDGGDGFDTLVVIGTEFGDDFVITENGVFGAGLNVNFVNIESLRVDGAEGNDRFFVKSTGENFITEIFGGLGEDTFNMSGDTPPIVSNDLLGHSGIILQDVESNDPRFDDQTIFGISANVADNDEPFAVIRQTGGSTIVTEGSSAFDSYEIVLTREPDTDILVNVLAPIPTPDDRERRAMFFRVDSPDIDHVLEQVDINGSNLTLVFTPTNWFIPQEVQVYADDTALTDNAGLFTRPDLGDNFGVLPAPFDMNDDAFEGLRFGVINHLFRAAAQTFSGTLAAVDNEAFTATISDLGIDPDDLLGRKIFITNGPGAGQSRFIVGVSDLGADWELTYDRAFSEPTPPDNTSEYFITIDDALVGKMSSFDESPVGLPPTDNPDDQRSTFTDSSANFPTAGEGLTGAILEIVGGPGSGQQRLILGHLPGDETQTLILNGPWRTDPVAGESIYRIERYDGLAIPSVQVQINDNDQAGLILDETQGIENLNNIVGDWDTITALIEGGDGDYLGEKDVVQVRLSAQPAGDVTVNLLFNGTQLNLTDLGGTPLSSLQFTNGNWDTFQPVVVEANADLLREGFHTSLIEFQIESSDLSDPVNDGNFTLNQVDEFESIPEEAPVFFVGLSHTPTAINSVTLNDLPLTEADSEGLNGNFIVLSNKIVFVDNSGQPVAVNGQIDVDFDYLRPGFDTALLQPILARISDSDAPTVLVRETDGSTDVIEVKTGGADPESISPLAFAILNFLHPTMWNDSYELVLTGQPTDDVTITVTPDITKTTRTGGIRHDLVQVEISSADGRVVDNLDGTLTVTFTSADDDWNKPVVIDVTAIDDGVVDGGDTKEFAPGPNTLSRILGPVVVEGAGGQGSLGIGAPVMLPGETNVKIKTGDVVSVAGTEVTVLTADLVAILADFELLSVDELVNKTIEVTAALVPLSDPGDFVNLFHSSVGQFRLITDVTDLGGGETKLTINEPYDLNLGDNTDELESDIFSYAITAESLNFFVDETTQVDVMFVHDEDSPADSEGWLTPTRLFGLNLGPDLVIGGQRRSGGITYGDLEVVDIDLGTGNNTFHVMGTHTREDGYQTWTLLNTGDDVEWFGVQGDTVNVHLNAVDETTATGTVATAQNVDADLGIFETTVTLDQSFADGELVGQLVNIVAGGLEENGGEAIGQSRRILDNSGFEVTVDGVWEFIPNGENYEIINEADGAFAVNTHTQGGDDTVDASSSSLGIVMFGGLGDDTLMGGSGNDIIFGDRGRVDYFNNDGAIVTRLGFAPEPILGFVTTQVIDDPVSLVTIEDSGASFPVPDEVADGVGTEDIGLEGLFVDINNGAGFLQTIRLITGNTADTLTISEPFDTDLDLPGPVPGNESEYRISTIPEDQTDGVIREANLLITVDNDLGGVDDIDAGEGDDQVFGGAGGDDIDAGVGEDVVVGDGGRLDRSRDPAAMDDQFESELGAVVIGTFMDRLRTISFADGGVDTLRGSAGRDFILGGQSGDIIFGDGVYGASPDTGDVIIGDNGEVDFADGLVNHIFTTDTTELTGGADTILGDDGDDIILGGVNGSSDDISGNDGDDIILGDNGELIYDDAVDPDLSTLDVIQTFLDGDGGSDTISGDAGSDIILGGSGGDTIYGDDSTGSNGTDDLADFIVGDNGRFDLTTNLIAQIVTTDVSEATGGADTISGNAGDDVILGGVNGSSDVLSGDDGDDILLGDNGQLIYDDAVDTDLGTLDIVHSFVDGRGGRDEMSGGAGRDILIGGMGGDLMYGDDDTGSNGTDDLTDFMLGDNGRFDLLNNLIAQIQTTDISEATGGADTMIGNADDDVMVGGVNDGGTDEIRGNDGEDVILGDNGLLVYNDAVIDPATPDPDLSTLDFVTTQDVGLGGRDVIFGHADDDLILAGRGNDWVHAGSENDIVFGDFAEVKLLDNLARYAQTIDRTDGGVDTIFGNEGEDVLVGGANDDRIDGDEGRDLIFGDNVELDRFAQTDFDDSTNPRYRTLLPDGVIYGEDIAGGTDGQDLIDNGQDYENPNGATVWENWEINILDHSDADETAGANNFGDDYIAGGAQDDTIFAQLGDDVIQGDGSIDSLIDDAIAVNAYRDNDGFLHVTPSFEAESDGDDYIEGNGGDDVVFGGLGQDDIIGGNSDLFSLDTPSRRPDGSDMIFGGAGTDGSRNHLGDETAQGHARDADMILGDNGDIFRVLVPEIEDEVIVGFQFATFNYDDYTLHLPEADQLRIVPRAARLLDYSVGGPDLNGGPVSDIGGADEIHGESGDDSIYGMMDGDALYGDGQDDDMIGGWGNDWLSGGTGIDGMLGDDGRIYTSRNTEKANNSDTELSEPLFGIAKLEDVDLLISTPGNIQQAVINVDGELKKSVNLAPFNVDDNTLMQDPLFNPFFADDIMFGGWGMDFMHGGAGDDAMSGAEALGLAKVKVFPDDGTTDDARNDFTIEETGFDRPVNPGNVLGANALRAEEFAAYLEYDPWAKITVDGDEFFLNFDHTEGPLADPATGVVNTDGDDRIFGDLGNDWIVGGTGKDRAYGGRGNDLMNMDDDHSTNGGANDMPDGPELSYEDIAYGGAGRDVLIANTGGDRLIDWIGEFNSYVVPFAPFGAATVSRTLQPQLPEYLYDLSESDGVDMTRAADTGNAADRNGEPDGELGLVLQKDADWNAQTGAPDDPQAGNIPGGARDVLTGANFNTGSAEGFFADSGTWTVSSGEFQVAPETLGEDAVSVFHVDEYLPTYFELRATVNGGKPTAGLKSNAYLIFDYQSESNFKFAGVNISTDKLEIGYRDADGWQVVEQTPAKLKPETDYDLLLALNGTNATLVVDNKDVLMYTFDPRVDADGWMYGLNEGMVGIGANNSTASIDDVIVQVLPPEITFQQTDDFSGSGVLFGGETIGAWQIVGSRYEVDATGGIAQSLTNLSVSSTSVIRLEGVLNTHGTSGYIFDRYSSTDFKFAAISADGDKVIIGHHTSQDGWTIDAEIAWTINSGEDYSLDVTLAGSTVSVLLNGQTVLSHAFNSVVV
ncbi:MAG: hypothetical protein GWM98_26665, partial [Nitrospinaceae bacterium]|nr:calcium-binding protein [Nitrospinaceae bacterium]NIR57399.1 calcium-binding protein [Nitrospinaceae bacterium]NIS87851.1 calcium-binding protein [Nitrospinaceae bacterium]NIT84722.1 calcium-binding protein [Nitrospinaceae bacterium]NIU46900.1 calcium-binding protein [Nitrospinaceae bacterium]